jgi:hypothetical protein
MTDQPDFPLEINTDHQFSSPIDDAPEVVQVSMFLVVFCCVIAGVSRRIGDLILGVIAIILWVLCQPGESNNVPPDDNIPNSVRTVLDRFDLDGQTTTFAVCPACHCNYKPRTTSPPYPSRCDNLPRPGQVCGEELLERSGDTFKPIKIFVYHHFHDYLARLLARPDIERAMDMRSDEVRDSLAAMDIDGETRESTSVTDIFEAEFIRTFRGPTGTGLFIDRPGTEGRYVFALNFDSFPPEGMKRRGIKASVGLLCMACLNLPLELRYKPENMYIVGIVPGPREPSLTQLNHYLRPLIDDLRDSWFRGIRFSRTALEPDGRTTRSAIAVCVCDLPAARKLAQMSSSSSHWYCSVCSCYRVSTLGRTDYHHDDWQPRDLATLRFHAEQWKSASSVADQRTLFHDHGVRWSELWRLPYWDPTRQLIVDSMHCLLLGLVNNHVRSLLGLTVEDAAKKPPVVPAFIHEFTKYQATSQPALHEHEINQVSQIHKLLTRPIYLNKPDRPDDLSDDSDEEDPYSLTEATDTDADHDSFDSLHKKLVSKNRDPLLFVCMNELQGVDLTGTKAQLANALITWVRDFPFN